tara:strand:- start:394 stop:867 length:474 start_codon:yes stop_codon:yes gene_type:complete
MNLEIERKFLVKELNFKDLVNKTHIKQYYISISDKMVQRLRFFDHKKTIISFKENNSGLSRYEFEYQIPLNDAKKMVQIIKPIFIEKIRYIVEHKSIKWEIDQFLGKNDGLIIAEVELEHEMQNIELPDWIDIEISNKTKYYNYNLAINPYSTWKGE